MAFQRHGKQETTLKSLQQRLSCFDGVCIIPVKVTKVSAGQQSKRVAVSAWCMDRQGATREQAGAELACVTTALWLSMSAQGQPYRTGRQLLCLAPPTLISSPACPTRTA